jgi:2,3,4,5-tetrahydropyridine-2-carboxylate N-succinyltransferase
MNIQQGIERLYDMPAASVNRDEALRLIGELKLGLNRGDIRAADKNAGTWKVNVWVKKGILLAFRVGQLVEFSKGEIFQFFDKDTMGVQQFTCNHEVRIVPGGTVVRDGAYVAPGVVIMPPAYINIGAYVDEHSMIDSHALIGSCAQIGRRVHCSAAAQIGGVLEPIGSMPVIIEDEVFIGGNAGIYEGTTVLKGAVIGAGVILTRSTHVYDLVRQKIYKGDKETPLTIPEGAVVIPGGRQIDNPFARGHGLSVSTPVVIKYRDEKTDISVTLEDSLR